MKKVIPFLLACALLILCAAGCGSGKAGQGSPSSSNAPSFTKAAENNKQPGEKVELRYARWGLPEEMNGTKKMLDAFTQANPLLTVKLENSSWEEYWQKLQTQIAGKSAPDVFLMDAGWYLRQFAPKGIITDLTGLMQRDSISQDAYYNVWKTFTYEDKIYALPRDYNSLLLFYNKDLFKSAGVNEYPTAGMTWEQLAVLAQKLTIDKDGKNAASPGFDIKNAVQYGLHVNTPDTDALIETLIWQNGGRLFSEDGSECLIDTPQARQVLQFLYDLTWKYKCKLSPAAAAKYVDAWFQSGKFAMVYQGTWMISALSDAKFDWDIVVPPTFGKSIYCVQSVGNSIINSTKHSEEAWQLVKYLSGKDGQTIMANENDAIPVLKEAAENVYMQSQSKPDNKKAIFDAAVESVPYIDFPNKGEIFDGIKNKLEPYFNNQESLDKAVDSAKGEVKRIQGK